MDFDFHNPKTVQMIAPIAVVVLVMALRMLRSSRARKLRVELMWVRPLIWVVLVGLVLAFQPPPLSWLSAAIMTAGLIIGCALGWQRGRFQHIEVDPQTHAVSTRASPLGLIFIVGLVLVRQVLRSVLTENAATLHLPATAILDALIIVLGASVIVQSLEMWIRARRLLSEVQARSIQSGSLNPPLVH